MTGHPVRLGDDGRLVITRRSPAEDAERLRHVARRLRAAAGAGAVELVQLVDDGDHVELALAFAGRPVTPPVRADVLAPLAAELSAHLSDLHLRGMVHGAVTADHVLVDASGTVRLCGFGHPGDLEPSADVHAFGLLVHAVLDPDDRTDDADTLRLHADRCCADEAARPTMAAISASLASIGTRGRRTPTPMRQPMERRWPRMALASTVLVAALALVALPRVSRADPRRDARPSVLATTTTTAAPATTSTSGRAARVWPRALEQDGAMWTLGDADDRTTVVDLDCDGIATPVVLQLPEGHVWVVDRWQDGSAARFLTTIAGAIDVDVSRSDECEVLVVETVDDEVRLTPSA